MKNKSNDSIPLTRLCQSCYKERRQENITKYFHTWYPGTKYQHTIHFYHCNDNPDCAEKAKTRNYGPAITAILSDGRVVTSG
ncbi:MAG TPA: hypothetical protein VN703_08380 [Candidatus Sulfopaludibacter sp.]|nr:hypothetical protein [Candidatus Sulfopaludibacter sp.]